MKDVHGTCNYDPETRILTITVDVKKGKKIVQNKQHYRVTNVNPDVRVADPAFELAKGEIMQPSPDELALIVDAKDHFVPSGEVYHVHKDAFSIHCDCPQGEIREKYNVPERCKHAKCLIKIGLIKDDHAARPQELSDEELPP